jgi:predicted  nucleic acid-binding Zn-ribbon protein
MPHKCARCGRVYDDGDIQILKGCSFCGGKKFYYIATKNIETRDKNEIKDLIYNNIQSDIQLDNLDTLNEIERFHKKNKKNFKNIIDDREIESIKIIDDGLYQLDLDILMRRDELIIEKKDGSYALHMPSLFKYKKKE